MEALTRPKHITVLTAGKYQKIIFVQNVIEPFKSECCSLCREEKCNRAVKL